MQLILTLILTALTGAQSPDDTMLTGKITRDQLEKASFKSWFTKNYDDYAVNELLTSQISNHTGHVEVLIFLGTWCPDSHKHVPAFFKIMDQMKYPPAGITLYALDHNKKGANGLGKKHKIQYVPTFIVKKNGRETGRIVESPSNSLEKDLLEILR